MAEALLRHDPVPSVPAVFPAVTIGLALPAARFSLRTRTPEGLPEAMLARASYGGGTALHLGPDEWLMILPAGTAPPAVRGLHALVDVSDRNLALIVEGARAEALLQTGCALDLSFASFPPGKATRTLFEGVEIVLWRETVTCFRVELWRSFAPWLWEALVLAARELG